jgi:hypothetical protein
MYLLGSDYMCINSKPLQMPYCGVESLAPGTRRSDGDTLRGVGWGIGKTKEHYPLEQREKQGWGVALAWRGNGLERVVRRYSTGQGSDQEHKRRFWRCQTRICTMTSNFFVTAFSWPGFDLRRGNYPSSPRLPKYRGWIRGAFASRSESQVEGRKKTERSRDVITMPVYSFRETMSVDAIE